MNNKEDINQLLKQASGVLQSEPERSVRLAFQVIETPPSQKTKEQMYFSMLLYGRASFAVGNTKRSIQYLEKTLQYALEHFPDNKEKISRAYLSLGFFYAKMDALETSLDYYFTALRFNVTEQKGNIFANIAEVYADNNDYVKALNYNELGIVIAEENQDHNLRLRFLVNSAQNLMELQNLELASKKIEEAENVRKFLVSDKAIVVDALTLYLDAHKARLKAALGYYDQAIELLDSTIQRTLQLKNQRIKYTIQGYKALVLLKKGDTKAGFALADTVFNNTQQHELRAVKIYLLKKVLKYSEEQEDYHNSHKYLKLLLQETEKNLNDSRAVNLRRIAQHHEAEVNKKQYISNSENALLEQLSSILSHDLKEPLRNIASFSDLLKKRYGADIDDEGQQFIQFISSGANKMNRSLVRLLEYTTLKNIEQDKIQNLYLPQLVENFYKQDENNEVHLHIDCSNSHINMIPEHANTLFYELISNAIKFRKGNECVIHITTQEKEDGTILLSFKDFGTGLEEQYALQIFKIFNKLNKNTKGEGVGLAICQRIVSLYQGSIYAISELGVSTTIHISLPPIFKRKATPILR